MVGDDRRTAGRAHPAPAFTLVEALVVLAVVAILLGVLLTAIGGADSAARRTACLANLRALHIAVEQHRRDNQEDLPEATRPTSYVIGWTRPWDQLARYISAPEPRFEDGVGCIAGPPYVCPSDRNVAENIGVSYAYFPSEMMPAMGVREVSRLHARNPHWPIFTDWGQWHRGGPPPPDGREHLARKQAVNLAGEVAWLHELLARP